MLSSLHFIIFVFKLHSAIASPTDRWQPFDIIGAAGFPSQNNEKGYECGNDFFSDSDINDALSAYHQYENKNPYSPLAYHAPSVHSYVQQDPSSPQEPYDPLEVEDLDISQYLDLDELDTPLQNNIPQEHQNTQQRLTPIIYYGPLYSDSASSNYLLWPIQKEKVIFSSTKYSSYPYYIVIKKNSGQVIDVISRIINDNHTRCIRIDSPRMELSTKAPEINNGYHCAHEFLSDDLIKKSLNLLWKNIGRYNKFPAPFVGRLYPAVGGYKIWPIFSRYELYNYNSVEVGPYFLVIDRQRNLVGIVVEGLLGNFLRCPRSRKTPKVLSSNSPSHSSGAELISSTGYYCGSVHFDDRAIEEAVYAAKSAVITKPFRKFPAKYNGHPFFQPLLLWPIMKNGGIYETGTPGRYRVVLTTNFGIKGVATMQKRMIQMCRKGMMKERDHENSDYYCIDHVLTKDRLKEAAENGCRSFNKRNNRFFPAIYDGPLFDKSGPYFTYPISMRSEYVGNPGKDRVIINSECEVVGAITTTTLSLEVDDKARRFVLCIKSQEMTNEKTYIEPDMPITENQCVETRRKMKLIQ